jgi:hypothetical protein
MQAGTGPMGRGPSHCMVSCSTRGLFVQPKPPGAFHFFLRISGMVQAPVPARARQK